LIFKAFFFSGDYLLPAAMRIGCIAAASRDRGRS